MNTVVREWNSHRIRKTKNSVAPAGRPIVMFDLPELYDTQDYLLHLNDEDVAAWETECAFPTLPCDEDIFELCNIILVEKNLLKNSDPYDTVLLYISLRKVLISLLENSN